MAQTAKNLSEIDPVWERIRRDAKDLADREPVMAGMVHSSILHHSSLEKTLGYRVALKLSNDEMTPQILREIVDAAYADDSSLGDDARADITAVLERDPACHSPLQPLLFFKGFQALQAYRVAHWLWKQGRIALATYLQNQISVACQVDIHPAARIGKAIMLDHATGIVIGETAVVENDVSILQDVTLGGTGKEGGDRHPKIREGVMIGAGAKILGNIEVGEGAKIGSCSVVLQAVPPHTTVAGVPAKIVGKPKTDKPSLDMDQGFNGRSQNFIHGDGI